MVRPEQHRSWISRICLRGATAVLAFVVTLGLMVVAIPSAQAQAYTVLYTFTGPPDGAYPDAGLVSDKNGNIYGTTAEGGTGTNCYGYGCGIIFKLDTTGETVLYNFAGQPDGGYPSGRLLLDTAGNLYGTSEIGGSGPCTGGCGTVFELDTTGKETVWYSFMGAGDGSSPFAGLVRDTTGSVYGTTKSGGASYYGTVYTVDTTGKETVLHTFTGIDGAVPIAALIRDAKGNFYGTTSDGGNNCFPCGTVFKLSTTGKESVLHSFRGYPKDGKNPYSNLLRDTAGNLYGTTFSGGASNYGTVFKLSTTGKESVLHSFTGADGQNPYAGLVRDPNGNLYGMTYQGGNPTCNFPYGCGTVFKLDKTGALTVLHSFAGGVDGAFPNSGLLRDVSGNLYGTTSQGGTSRVGTVFKLTP